LGVVTKRWKHKPKQKLKKEDKEIWLGSVFLPKFYVFQRVPINIFLLKVLKIVGYFYNILVEKKTYR
jgi:hypothetical protein